MKTNTIKATFALSLLVSMHAWTMNLEQLKKGEKNVPVILVASAYESEQSLISRETVADGMVSAVVGFGLVATMDKFGILDPVIGNTPKDHPVSPAARGIGTVLTLGGVELGRAVAKWVSGRPYHENGWKKAVGLGSGLVGAMAYISGFVKDKTK